MANFQAKLADAINYFFKSTGTGTDLDPFMPHHIVEQEADTTWDVDLTSPANIDGSLNTANLFTLAVYKQDKFRDDRFFDTETIGGGTAVYENANGGVKMSVTTTNDAVIRQSNIYHPYFSGSPQFIELTAINIAPQTNVTKRVGAFNTDGSVTPFNSNRDGFYLESSGGLYYFKVDKGGSNVFSAAQSTWNLDKLDGNGKSGLTLAGANFEALTIEYLYLGGTCVRFGFLLGDTIVWCHRFDNANVNASTFVISPNQPVRYEIRSTGSAGHLYQVCARVGSKGTQNIIPFEIDYEPANFINASTVDTVYAVCGVRLNNLNSVVRISKLYAQALTADRFKLQVRKNPTVAGTFTYNSVTGTGYDIAIGDSAGDPSTNTVTGGEIIFSRTIKESGDLSLNLDNLLLQCSSNIDGTVNPLVLCIASKGLNLDVDSGFTVRELI